MKETSFPDQRKRESWSRRQLLGSWDFRKYEVEGPDLLLEECTEIGTLERVWWASWETDRDEAANVFKGCEE